MYREMHASSSEKALATPKNQQFNMTINMP